MWQQHISHTASCLSLAGFRKSSLTGNIQHKKACRILEIWNLYFDEETKVTISGSWGSLQMFDKHYFNALLTLQLDWSEGHKPSLHDGEGRGGSHSPKRLLLCERANEILLEKQQLLHSYSDEPCYQKTVWWGMSIKREKWSIRFNCKTASLLLMLVSQLQLCTLSLNHNYKMEAGNHYNDFFFTYGIALGQRPPEPGE